MRDIVELIKTMVNDDMEEDLFLFDIVYSDTILQSFKTVPHRSCYLIDETLLQKHLRNQLRAEYYYIQY